jgi:hypothetical protein
MNGKKFLAGVAAAALLALGPAVSAAAPADYGPVTGSAVATQDPPGSCPGRPGTIPFTAMVRILGGQLQITDPGGNASGPIAPDGTGHLSSPQGETYDILSSAGGGLMLEEVNGGCRFRTVISFVQPFPSLATATSPAPTPAPTTTTTTTTTLSPATNIPTTGPGVPNASGSSLTWLWVVLVVAGGLVIVGAWILGRGPVVIAVAHDCGDELRRWQQLQAICDESRAAAARAADEAKAARERREALGKELSAYRDAHPGVDPAGDNSYVEDVATGQRVTITDVALQRQAEQEIYQRYRQTQGPEAAATAVDEWRKADTPEARAERRRKNAADRDEYQRMEKAFRDAEATEQALAKAAASAQAKADADCRQADIAHRAYDECIRQAAAAAVAEEASRDDGLPLDGVPKPKIAVPSAVDGGGVGDGGIGHPDCDCAFGIDITGPDTFEISECRRDYSWALEPPTGADIDPGQAQPVAPGEVRVLRATPAAAGGVGAQSPPGPRLRDPGAGQLAQRYQTRVIVECRGGGTLTNWRQQWALVRSSTPGADGAIEMQIEVEVSADVQCPGQPPRTVSAMGIKAIAVVRSRCCCGPDVTDDYLACLNRVISRLAAYPESRGWTTSGVEFLARNGIAMAYRPFPSVGMVQPGDCPCPGCVDTVTLLDVCVPAHVTGDLLFGVCAGWFGTDKTLLTVGGVAAKWAHYPQPALPDTAAAEKLWDSGYGLGDRAYDAHNGDRPAGEAAITRQDLADVLARLTSDWRRDCDACPHAGPSPAPIDFSRVGWDW